VITGDIEELRAEYLFPLAKLCGIRDPELGQLNLADFANYIDSVDAYVEAMKKEG
jgi:hypothetical protein